MIKLLVARYRLAFEIAVLVALALGVSFGVARLFEHEREIGRAEVRAEYAAKLVAAQEAARQREQDLQHQRDDAVAERDRHEQTIRQLAASAGAASGSLRDTLAAISRGVPSATVEALRYTTATLSTVLAECTGEYQALAERADRHANDAQALDRAFPQQPKPP